MRQMKDEWPPEGCLEKGGGWGGCLQDIRGVGAPGYGNAGRGGLVLGCILWRRTCMWQWVGSVAATPAAISAGWGSGWFAVARLAITSLASFKV